MTVSDPLEMLTDLYFFPSKAGDLEFGKNTAQVHKVNVKTLTIPILMHQMRILTNYVSSVMLRPKTLENQNISKIITRRKMKKKNPPLTKKRIYKLNT
jgi:hypothetical protein